MLRENGLSKNGTLFRGIVPCAPVLAVEIARLMLIPILLLPLLRSLLTFLTFLRMRHKGLFIIASDIIESHFVDLDRISGLFLYVFYDNLVIRMILIVLVALGAHVTRQVIDGPRDYLGILLIGQTPDHPFDIFAVMLVLDMSRRLGHTPGHRGKFLARRLRIGGVHIQLKVGHDEQVIPQLVSDVGRIPQQVIQVSHNVDDRTGLPVALAAVFELHQRSDHFVNMAAVFGQKKLPSFIIIIFLHNFCGSSVALLLRTVPITF